MLGKNHPERLRDLIIKLLVSKKTEREVEVLRKRNITKSTASEKTPMILRRMIASEKKKTKRKKKNTVKKITTEAEVVLIKKIRGKTTRGTDKETALKEIAIKKKILI